MTAKRTDWTPVAALAEEVERGGGIVGIAIIAPGGERYARHGARPFRAASTVKIPLMIEIYRQIDRGERALDDPHTLRAADKTPGSGVLLHLHDGLPLTLNDLIYLMISISDNTATNILIDLAGMDRVNATMRALGMATSTLGRKMRGRPAQGDEPENWATPDEYATVVGTLLEHRAASPDACDRMLTMLERQQNARRLARHLPEREDVRWGSKTGSIVGVTNDIGFITTPRGTLIASVFCEHLADQHIGEQLIGEISRAALHATNLLDPL